VYAEAYVTVHQYDIVLDVTVVNRSPATLQNLNLELATMGDLKLVERPQNHTLGPGASKTIRANIKVRVSGSGSRTQFPGSTVWPQNHTLGPGAFKTIRASVKVRVLGSGFRM
jgi:Coatomer beta C-terminal region